MKPLLRVLIIEDVEDDEELVLRQIRLGGYEVKSLCVEDAHSLEQALDSQEWDVIIADYRLPHFDALAALDILRQRELDLPFLIVSGTIGEQVAVAAMKAGAHDYIMKDNLARLVPAIERELRDAGIRRERRQVEQQVKESHEQMRRLAAHLQRIREEERKRISREIHDELGQRLTSFKFELKLLADDLRTGPLDPSGLAQRTDSIRQMVDQTVKAVRRIATDLRPGILDELGLAAAIEWQAQEFQTRTQIVCNLEAIVEDASIDNERATAVFRIFQETLTNIARHSGATEVRISLEKQNGFLVLEVQDNGCGIAEKELRHSRSLGMLGMRERAQIFGGEFVVKSEAGQGAIVTLRMPLG